jgi:hypothetical protein
MSSADGTSPWMRWRPLHPFATYALGNSAGRY